jgi:ABC-type sulfate/molybdate transport systems ATPase subunit
VSQDLHLFPHLTVCKNLLIAMDHLDRSVQAKRRKTGELLELLRIDRLGDRMPSTLSGGEKQRAALARVLASEPKLLLLDEPLSKLDFRTARYLRIELKSLLTRLGLTSIFVTHNLQEAREMGDHLAVLNDGRLRRIASERDTDATDTSVEDRFLDMPNLFYPDFMEPATNGLIKITWAEQPWYVPDEGRRFTHAAVLPGDIEVGVQPPPGPQINRFTATVTSVDLCDYASSQRKTTSGRNASRCWAYLTARTGRPTARGYQTRIIRACLSMNRKPGDATVMR